MPRIRTNVERSIPTMLQLLEEHGVVDNFRRLSGRKKADRRGPLYADSDLYKWIEAVAFKIERRPDRLGGITVLRHTGVAAETPLTDEPRGADVHSLLCMGESRSGPDGSLDSLPVSG
jgi:hypothetical protein